MKLHEHIKVYNVESGGGDVSIKDDSQSIIQSSRKTNKILSDNVFNLTFPVLGLGCGIITIGYLVFSISTDNDYVLRQSTAVTNIQNHYNGTGGVDEIKFTGNWLRVDQNHYCDEDVWRIDGDTSTTVYYDEEILLGTTFTFSFASLGVEGANLAFGRPELYEIVLGDGSHEHVSIKNLRTDSSVELNNSRQGKVKLNSSLDGGRLNKIKVQETVTDNELFVDIMVNGQMVRSGPISIAGYRTKGSTVYFGLLDFMETNNTAIQFSDLNICRN